MLTIDPELFTVIVHFEVPPENQKGSVTELTETVDTTIAMLPGFRSATFWASDDGTSVVNLAQWESSAAYESSINSNDARDSGVLDLVGRHGARQVDLDSPTLSGETST